MTSSTKENMSDNAAECCEICHRTPAQPSSMQCSECGKRFHNSTCLAKHFLQHLFWTCGECGRSFDSQGAKHDCDAEGEADAGRSRLVPAPNGTYVREYAAGVACALCAKVFVSRAVMEQHRRRVHAKEKAFACGLCDKKFRFSSQQREHFREHTGEKPFACHLCSRSYSRRAQLRRHVALHSESRLHVCLECERGFTRKESLALHALDHLKTEPDILPSSC